MSLKVLRLLIHPYEPGWPPSARVAVSAGWEHGLSSRLVTDEAPGFTTNPLFERVSMADFRRDRLAAVGTDGAERLVHFRSIGAALGRHGLSCWQGSPRHVYHRQGRDGIVASAADRCLPEGGYCAGE